MIIKLTESDRLIGTLVETNYYPMVVTKFNDPKPSKSGKSLTTFVDLQIADGKFKGKELTVAFNTETTSPSVLGSMHWMPIGFLYNLAAAVLNIPIGQVPTDIDTDLLVAKVFDGRIEKTISDGTPINVVTAFLPAGMGITLSNAAVPF